MRTAKLAATLLALLLAPAAPRAAPAGAAGFKVIAHPEVSVDSLPTTGLSDLFLKRTTTWPNGANAHPVDQGEGSPLFEAFATGVHRKSGAVIRAFWKRVTLSGRDTPPTLRSSDEEVLAFVRATRGSIGYVSAATATAGVKVIAITP